MTIQIGDTLPDGTLQEFFAVEQDGCPVGPHSFSVADQLHGKTVAIFGIPGAFTPTCSERHLPGYLANHDALRANGIDEIWCFAVNDAFVMGAWGHDQGVGDKIRMVADGSGTYTAKLGLELDLVAAGLGTRCKRFSLVAQDGVVTLLNVEEGGELKVSGAETMLEQIG